MLTESAGLLAVWEEGLPLPAAGRAHALHRAARPDTGEHTLRTAPVGMREADLYTLRQALFGDRMPVVLECASCTESMEFELSAGELARRPDPAGEVRVDGDGWELTFRLPSPADLTAVASPAPGGADARDALLVRCTTVARHGGKDVPAERLPGLLPESVRERLAAAAEEADPAAAATFGITCPECGAATSAALDIASHLWTELDSWARDVLLDIHLLATAYGWSEPQILALSPTRRRHYLELCADA